VRHHLNVLLADGLIESDSVRRKVGRPYYVYSVTEKGNELFPKTYLALSNRLLDEMKERFSAEIVAELFQGVVQGILDDHAGEFEHLPFEERLNYLVQLLDDEGFLAKWEKNGDRYDIIEYSCPLLSIGQTHQEVCTLDTALIKAVMQMEIEQHSCMIEGDNCCRFTIGAPLETRQLKLIALEEVETR
jgi:predicted ArsR family transcriptional regulator